MARMKSSGVSGGIVHSEPNMNFARPASERVVGHLGDSRAHLALCEGAAFVYAGDKAAVGGLADFGDGPVAVMARPVERGMRIIEEEVEVDIGAVDVDDVKRERPLRRTRTLNVGRLYEARILLVGEHGGLGATCGEEDTACAGVEGLYGEIGEALGHDRDAMFERLGVFAQVLDGALAGDLHWRWRRGRKS